MIPQDTINEIFEKCIIEDVISSYLPDLKKKGANYWACCPFHNEKTPSFSVSPSKGIYKCFGCGKGGNSVNFVMEIGGLSYPEALKELAAKYNIEYEEKELTPDQINKENKRQGVLLISSYANKFFQKNLWETKEGKVIGLSYFKQRGFSESTIKKFQLGYSPKEKRALTQQAIKDSYQKKILEESGLSLSNVKGNIDKFNGRVIFPIHNYAGKVLAFGGRLLDSSKKAKYLNSPENPIYHKSQVLYGLYFGKISIGKKDTCYIVEGYTDVISMHQCGIENVVSASGTSLSAYQINLIRRFTKNITLLFDADKAGIKASFKSIDLILKEGMNVRIVMFPEGEDPDSYSQKLTEEEFSDYLSKNQKDFIQYKTELLNNISKNDPTRRVESIKDIAKSISLIPDQLLRSEYCKISSSLLDIHESDLLREISNFQNDKKLTIVNSLNVSKNNSGIANHKNNLLEECEKEILRLLLNYGEKNLEFEDYNGKVSVYILEELANDKISFSNKFYKNLLDEYAFLISKNKANVKHFLNHENVDIQQLSINLLSRKHEISKKWGDLHQIFIGDETKNLERTIEKSILSFKQAYLKSKIEDINMEINQTENPSLDLIERLTRLNKGLVAINKLLGRNFN